MNAIGLGRCCLEHDVGPGFGTSAHVLLAEVLDMSLNGRAGLRRAASVRVAAQSAPKGGTQTYQLLLQGDLLQLHLVHSGVGGASKGSRGDEGALHDGRRLGGIGGTSEMEFGRGYGIKQLRRETDAMRMAMDASCLGRERRGGRLVVHNCGTRVGKLCWSRSGAEDETWGASCCHPTGRACRAWLRRLST